MVINKDIVDIVKKVLNVTHLNGIKPIKGDGSDRKFYRIRTETTTFVCMISPPENTFRVRENQAFQYFSRHLASLNLPVPKLYAFDLSKGLFLMEDLGDISLQQLALKKRYALENIYRKVVQLLALLHKQAPRGFDPSVCIDGEIYDPLFVLEKELEYFRRVFLCHFLSLPALWKNLKDDFFELAEKAGSPTRRDGVIHRDFQSRNIMIKNECLYLIDFQAMRYGPFEYDLASLLIDPYVSLPEELRKRLITLYHKKNTQFSWEKYEVVKLCRNLQMLAAFVFLGVIKGKTHFTRYIKPAWKELKNNSFLKTSSYLKNLRSWLDEADKKIMDMEQINCYSKSRS